MVGGNQGVVVETGITSGVRESLSGPSLTPSPVPEMKIAAAETDEFEEPPRLRSAPRPAVFGDHAPNLRPVERQEAPHPRDDERY